jgi:hypothetical protein
MQTALTRHLGDLAEWTQPNGGLFFWVRLKGGGDTRALLVRALERKVAFMPGEAFFANPERGARRVHAPELQSRHARATGTRPGGAGGGDPGTARRRKGWKPGWDHRDLILLRELGQALSGASDGCIFCQSPIPRKRHDPA